MEPYPQNYPQNLTWESLNSHIENLILWWDSSGFPKVVCEDISGRLRWYLPLVSEAQKRDKLQVLIPYLGMNEIYLIYRSQQKDLIIPNHAFALISSVGDGMYRLGEFKIYGSWDTNFLLNGDRFQILDMVEKLVENTRVREQG